jgi:hypothetical protein
MFVLVDRCRMAFSSEYSGSSHQLPARLGRIEANDDDPLRLPASFKHFHPFSGPQRLGSTLVSSTLLQQPHR